MHSMGKRVYRRRRRLKVWVMPAVVVLLAVAVIGGYRLLFTGEAPTDQGGDQNQQIGTEDPGGDDRTGTGSDPTGDGTGDAGGEETTEPADPMEGYTIQTMTEADLGSGEMILVSNEHKYTFPTDVESQLVTVIDNKSSSYTVNLYETLILPVTVEHLNQFLDDYVAQGGAKDVMVVSGYRTYDFQQGLFDRSAARNGLEHAQRFVAQAGGSEHHTGYAVDLYSNNNGDYFEGVGEYKWVTDHCHEYGFILRYTEEKEPITMIGPESWHFRYVSVPHSYIIVDNDFCLEEYIDYLCQFPFDGEHLTYTVGDQEYEIYYVEGLEVPVPESGNYTVSGNNVDGFIVTIEK